MTDTLDPALRSLAAAQSGMFSTRQALEAGVRPLRLQRLVKDKILRHPGRGLYAVADLVDDDAEAWHRHLMAGALLLYPDAVFTGVSAVLAHGIRVWGADLGSPQILRRVQRGTTMTCFHLRPQRDGDTAVTTELGSCVPAAEALVQLAVDEGIAPGLVSMDHALHDGRVSLEDLETALDAIRGWPRSAFARAAVEHADARRESVAESRCALILALAGLPVIPQVEIRDGAGQLIGRVDFLIEGTNVIVEVDGKVKYASGDPEVLWAEKRREDRLRRAGYIVVRVTWADLERYDVVVGRVHHAMVAA